MAESLTLGIDLGTTNSVAAVWYKGRPIALPIQNREPRELLRSVVLLENAGRVHVGEEAWNRRALMPDRLIASVKSMMGTAHLYTFDGRDYTPEEISSLILKEIIARAKAQLARIVGSEVEIRNVIITVPARFGPNALRATAKAAELAGYPAGDWREAGTHELMRESDAAAIAYIKDDPNPQTVLVYDLGGGTFDVTIMRFNGKAGDPRRPFDLLGTPGGDPRLGGDVFDQRLFERMVEHFNTADRDEVPQRVYPHYFDLTTPAPDGPDPKEWIKAQQTLHDEARRFKEVVCDAGLPADRPHEIILPELIGRTQPVPFAMTRLQFEALISDKLDATAERVDQLLAETKISKDDIDRLVLAGGSTRIPRVSALLRERFGMAPNSTLEPDKAIAMGAAIYAELRRIILPDLPKKVLTVPIGLKVTRRTFESIIGDYGKEGEERNGFAEVLPRGLVCPGEATTTVTTTRNNQQKLLFQVFQNNGEEGVGLCQPDDYMGWFELTLPQEARGASGVPQVQVTFSINAEMTDIDVRAAESRSGQEVATHLVIGQHADPPPEDSGGSGIADIVFVVDTTGSMGSHINGMKARVKEFATKVGDGGVDYRLALVDFRDVTYKERLTVHPFQTDIAAYQRLVDTMGPGGGGDEPESAIDALEAALGLSFRAEAQKIFVLITDASTHEPSAKGTNLKQLGAQLKAANVAMYVVSAEHHHRRQYAQLIDTAEIGRFFKMGDPFDMILDGIVDAICDVTLA